MHASEQSSGAAADLWLRALRLSTRAVTEFALQGKWQEALSLAAVVREESIPVDVVIYNRVISAFHESNRWMSACQMLDDMRHGTAGLRPDVATYSTTLTALADGAASWGWQGAFVILQSLQVDGGQPDAAFFRTVMKACREGEMWPKAVALLPEMQQRDLQVDVVSFGAAMLSASSAVKGWPAALSLFRNQRQLRIHLDTTSLNAALLACMIGAKPIRAIALFRAVRKLSMTESNVLTFTIALSALERTDSRRQAAWCRALHLLNVAKRSNVRPNIVTFGAALKSCEKQNQWRQIQELVSFSHREGVVLDKIAYDLALRTTFAGKGIANLSPLS